MYTTMIHFCVKAQGKQLWASRTATVYSILSDVILVLFCCNITVSILYNILHENLKYICFQVTNNDTAVM